MKRFVPEEKMSKRARKDLHRKRRRTWAISPVTRKPDNPKAYKRKKVQPDDDDFIKRLNFLQITAWRASPIQAL